jgi:hypothetical protein
MRYRGLALYPILYAVVFALIALWLDSVLNDPFVFGQKTLARVLAVVGSVAAVSAFERGDHLRRAWLWLTSAATLVLIRDLLSRFVWTSSPDAPLQGYPYATIATLGVVSNVLLLGGIYQLARSWKKADIPLPGGTSGSLTVGIVGAVVALVVAGPSAVHHGGNLLHGDLTAMVGFASSVVDILSLCLLAPLLLTAVALRGGLFAWPWALITASILSWLFYDAAYYITTPQGFPWSEVFRGLALNFQFAAGLAQRFAVGQLRRAAE